jgi:hypothetical protein
VSIDVEVHMRARALPFFNKLLAPAVPAH